jgi:hypothetical protein
MLGLGTLRVIPNWCNWPVVGGVSDLLGAEACKPYTESEIEADFQAGLAMACRGATDPEECAGRNRVLYDAQLTAATTSAPAAVEGSCEYEASQSSPNLSRLIGARAVCKMQAGEYTVYIVIAAAVAFLLLLPHGGRRR